MVDPGWVSVGFAALALLQVASLAQQRTAREDRRAVMEKIDTLIGEVAEANGRVGRIETWRDEHVKSTVERTARLDETDRSLSRRIDDSNSWRGPERRRSPRRSLTEE